MRRGVTRSKLAGKAEGFDFEQLGVHVVVKVQARMGNTTVFTTNVLRIWERRKGDRSITFGGVAEKLRVCEDWEWFRRRW